MNPLSLQNYRALVDGLKQFETIAALRRSQFYAEHGKTIESIIDHIWHQPCSRAVSQVNNFVRAVQWNIERGKHLEAIVDLFMRHPVLSRADLISLNEVDLGMNRTGNRNIAFELGSCLGMHVIFAAEYLELTKGIGAEATLAGENCEALHGNALLSRYPLREARLLRLPSCFNAYQFSEKRYGNRIALIAEVDFGSHALLVVNTHLEVRNTPACRARQFRALLDDVAPLSRGASESTPILIAGDLNTGTFKRGRALRAASALMRLLRAEPAVMKYALRHPEQVEPLFALAAKRGFHFEGFNDDLPTCSAPLAGLDEAKYLPSGLSHWVFERLAVYDHRLEFRLDYFLARGLRPLTDGECTDTLSNAVSMSARTLPDLYCSGSRISDHDPIVCDFKIRC